MAVCLSLVLQLHLNTNIYIGTLRIKIDEIVMNMDEQIFGLTSNYANGFLSRLYANSFRGFSGVETVIH